ncbi:MULTISPECIES: MFS transporter [unclassified Brevibacterium]|uniref:MFS transporter n=1 Tax=unclassified Brevibacterium TaxID=2614124 RepID=UPI0010F71EB3|nr:MULTISPECIES: MFS transporter [unclassified Brevibacterium]MCM1013641.1 MFS transporter [Brevibacterium sp. XM4083]
MTSTDTGAALLGRRGTLALAAAGLSLIAACYGLARFAFGLFLPAFRADFGLDAQTAGAIASGAYIAYCLAIVAATILTPRCGARPIAVCAGVIATVGTGLIAAAPSTAMLAIGVLIAGSSTGVASPPLAQAVAQSVRSSVRGRTQTVINAGTGLGVAVAGPIALLTLGQWRWAWIVFAVLSALVTLWVLRAVPSPGRTGAAASSPRGTGAAAPSPRGAEPALLPRPLVPRGSTPLMAASALMGFASAAVWTFGRDLLVGVGGMGETASAIAWILLGAFGMLGAVSGDLAAKVGLRCGWLVAMLILAASTLLFAAVPGSIAGACAAAAVFGAVYIALTGLLLVWGTEVYDRAPAAGVGLAFLLIAVGQALGAPLLGALITGLGAGPAFAVAAGIAVVGAFLGPPRS